LGIRKCSCNGKKIKKSKCGCKVIVNCPECPQCPPCPPTGITNPPVPCTCSSTFAVNQTATVIIVNQVGQSVPETGIFSLNGSICPNCNNAASNFTVMFVDTDLSDGNQSFTFVPTSIQPINCSIINFEGSEHLQQVNNIVGIYTPVGGTPTIVQGQLVLRESTTPGQDDRIIFSLSTLITNNLRVAADVSVPDTSLFVTQCP
jgi:hypothetical protein